MRRKLEFDGQTIEVAEPISELPSVLLLGLPKSGTTLLTKIFKHISPHAGIVHLDLHGKMFKLGISREHPEIGQLDDVFQATGYAYGAFREVFPFLQTAKPTGMPVIWIRRDPKDVIVSRYFSEAFSHELPGNEEGAKYAAERERVRAQKLNEFALQELDRQVALTQRYLDGVPSHNLHVFWYEDVIYEKARWISDMMKICGWDVAQEHIESTATKVDEQPANEDPNRFIRQVHPGNFAKHLTPKTAELIDKAFAKHVPSWTRPK